MRLLPGACALSTFPQGGKSDKQASRVIWSCLVLEPSQVLSERSLSIASMPADPCFLGGLKAPCPYDPD